ncbi:hypothetical protein SD641_004645 [Vibrio parahaemolyticus]|nr:hypothetical protein [Vibrio parahaemolyticus]
MDQSNSKSVLLKIEPSFKGQVSKKKQKARALVKGSYEWALRQPLPKNSKKFRLAIDSKYTRSDLEKEVQQLENEIAFTQPVSEKTVNRQIVMSYVLKEKIIQASKAIVASKLDNKIEIERKKLKEQTRRDRSQGSALGSEFDQKFSIFVPGGAPGSGKRS